MRVRPTQSTKTERISSASPGAGSRKVRKFGKAPNRLIQLWFAGNHSDIGGSYAEAESRLSDNALWWMIE
jgi:hypothetical protein